MNSSQLAWSNQKDNRSYGLKVANAAQGFGMNKKVGLKIALLALMVAISVVIAYFLFLKPVEIDAFKSIIAASDARPAGLEKSYLFAGNLCDVDARISPTRQNQIVTAKNIPFIISGWVVPASTGRELPPRVFAILSGDKGVFWFEGKRTLRPDVSAVFGSNYFDQGGFEVIGDFSDIPVGEYKLSIATGSEFVMGACVTNKVIHVKA